MTPGAAAGASTPSQTAWALLALLAADGVQRDPQLIERGVAWLVGSQRDDGGWDEEQYTGTGFPGDFYIGYEMYRLVFPISALGRYVRAVRGVAAAAANDIEPEQVAETA